MSLPVSVLKMLFASSLFSSGFFTSGKRIKQQKAEKLMEVQATHGMPPLGPLGLRESSSSSHKSYGQFGMGGRAMGEIGRAMGFEDKKSAAAIAEDALEKSNLYEGLWKKGGQAAKKDAAPSAADVKAVYEGMDKNKDGKLDLQELHQGMKALPGPMMPADEIRQFHHSADRNHDGKVNLEEFLTEVQAQAAMSAERPGIVGAESEEDAVKMIDSLIAQEVKEYNDLAPKWAAFMQKLEETKIKGQSTSNVFMAFYKHCGTSSKFGTGYHESCVVDKLQPLVCKEAEQTLSDGKTTFLHVFVQMVFVQLERQLEVFFLEKIKEQE